MIDLADMEPHDVLDSVAQTLRLVPRPGDHRGVEADADGTRPRRAGNQYEWPEPIPLDESRQLPPFPMSSLPDWLATYVVAEAEATQTPPDLAGMMVMSAVAAATAGMFEVRARDGWIEPLSLYSVVSLPPGDRKSAVVRDVSRPLRTVEIEMAAADVVRVAREASERAVLEARLKQAEKAAARASTIEREQSEAASAFAEQLARLPMRPATRLLADDVTMEKLATLMSEQGGRMAVLTAEGELFDVAGGRYSRTGPNIGVLLYAHAGDQIRIDRIGRPSDVIRRPCLTLGLAVQPQVLSALDHPALLGRGLLARVAWVCPKSLVGSRVVPAPAVSSGIADAYEGGIAQLARLLEHAPRDDRGELVPATMVLEPAAGEALIEFERWLEPQLAEDAALGRIADWGAKLAGLAVRLAGLIRLARLRGAAVQALQGERVDVTIDDVAGATELARYLIPHAQTAYALIGADPIVEAAKKALVALQRLGEPEVTRRDLRRQLRGPCRRPKDFDAVVDLLLEHGHVCEAPSEERRGRPSPALLVHPSVLRGR